MTDDAFDTLEESKASVGGGGDYAPWWNDDNFGVSEGDKLIGVVVEKHNYTDPGGDEHPVATVRSVGRGSLEKGTEVSTPTRKGIEPFADDAELGDLALIEYTGQVQANSGRDMHTYEASKLTQAEWKDTEQADTIQEVWDDSSHSSGGSGNDQGASVDDTDDEDEDSGSIPEKAIDFAEDTVNINGGELTLDELDEYLNDIRDYNVEPKIAAKVSDTLEVDGNVVREA